MAKDVEHEHERGKLVVVTYRVIVDRDRCIGCGISIGRCPTHARLLSQILESDHKGMSGGIFSEETYDRVKKLVDECPEKAIIIEKITE